MKNDKVIEKIICFCSSKEGLFIPNRRISIIIAGFVVFLFFAFYGGYLLGKKHCIGHNAKIIEQNLESASGNVAIATLKNDFNESFFKQDNNNLDKKSFYAQIVGFGTSSGAHRFAQRLQKKGIDVAVKTRYSKSPKGRNVSWYQVVTNIFDDREALEQLVKKIASTERLSGMRIVSC